jgi:hypothetical protein
VSSIDFCAEAEETRVRRNVDGRDAWFLSAESLAVFKLMLFRGKDLVDLERMTGLRDGSLESDRVRRTVVAMVGEADERIAAWDRIVRIAAGGAA